ncbi:MAG TPA: hypothetical protein VFU21_30355, partial [Kofleriaceae bacterium]|nr:hypothetical protein [Kofleriaceae bacterium]
MTTPTLAIDAPQRVLPGETFEGIVRWQLAAAPDAVELRLRWRTSGAGRTDEHVVETVDVAGLPTADPAAPGGQGPYRGMQAVDLLAPRPLSATDARRFRLRAPPSPPSFRGSLVRLTWQLELAAGKHEIARPIVISPTSAP